ncbi:MAG: inorganic phosphate transporter [Clostridiaceae bacterium]|nr:inorganic phosphate transporter [Clostridiaceae bacterium]
MKERGVLMSLFDFLQQIVRTPMLFVSTILALGVILVNGWTDAPNAIATCVSTRAITVRRAIIMAAVFNFLGVFVMTSINASVAMTIYNIVDFGGDTQKALVALCAAMAAIVMWATLAWYFGIPTSESHALIAGLSGAAIAIQNDYSGINGTEWIKVLWGLVLSTVLGFVMGFICAKLTAFIFSGYDRIAGERILSNAQVAGGAAMAFMHGAQDGQKFMAVILLGVALANGQTDATTFVVPVWLMVVCSVFMALGTSIGGYRIIKSVGMDMVKLRLYQGFSADLAASMCLLLSSLTGIPVSTTHTKTTAIMGVGASRSLRNINWNIVKDLIFAWICTFPGCGLLGFLMAKLFLALFA